MRKGFLLPGIAVICGIIGAVLRHVEWQTGFEPETGLAIPGNVPAIALIIFSALVFVFFFLFFLRTKVDKFSGGYDEAFYAPHPGYMIGTGAAALIIAVAGALIMADAIDSLMIFMNTPLTEALSMSQIIAKMVLGIFAILSGLAMVATARNNFQGEHKGKYSLILLVPAFFCCYWIILAYENHAANPVVLEYVYELFAVICILLAFYFMAGFGFEKPKVKSASLFCLCGIYFSIVTLTDGHPLSTTLIYIAMLLYLLFSVGALLNNVEKIQKEEHPLIF